MKKISLNFSVLCLFLVSAGNFINADDTAKPWTIKKAPDNLPITSLNLHRLEKPSKESLCKWIESEKCYLCPSQAIMKGYRCEPEGDQKRCYTFVTFKWEAMLDKFLKLAVVACDNNKINSYYEQSNFPHSLKVFRISYKIGPGLLYDLAHYTDPNCVACGGYYWYWYSSKEKLKDLLASIYKMPGIFPKIYEWAIPSIKQAFQSLPRQDQVEYMKIIRHVKKYAQGYNHKAELTYLKKIEKKTSRLMSILKKTPEADVEKINMLYGKIYETEISFIRAAYGKKFSPFRELEAFIFRRVQEGMDIRIIKKMLIRVERDLKPLVAKG